MHDWEFSLNLCKKLKFDQTIKRYMRKPISLQEYCNLLALDPAFNQETGASGRRYRGITLTCGRVEFGAIATPTGSRWMSNNYITRCHRQFRLVGVQSRQSTVRATITVRVPVAVGDKMP